MTIDIISKIGNTPLVQINHIAASIQAPIYGKCEFLNPGGSVKDRIAKAIIEDAEKKGLLHSGMTLIEATAGNTGMGLAMMAASRGYKLVCIMPEKMSVDKRTALAMIGAEVIITANAPPSDPRNFRRVAERLAQENGWFLTRQFENPANPLIHEQTTGPEILEQCNGRVGAFVCGVGTGGTISGVGRYLKKNCPKAKIILADPVGSRLAHFVNPHHPDLDSSYQVEGIGGSETPANLDLSVIDAAVRITDDESFLMSGRLIREEGLLVGGSSGTAMAATVRWAAENIVDDPIVVILADSWDRYAAQPWMKQLAN